MQFSRQHYRVLVDLLLPLAMQTTQGIVLAQAAVDELRRRHVLLPPVPALEKLCAAVATRAQREVHRLLTTPLSDEQRSALDQLLLPLTDRSVCRKELATRSIRIVCCVWRVKAARLLSTSSRNMKPIGVTPRWWRFCSTPPRR
jgi:hypothetical protein